MPEVVIVEAVRTPIGRRGGGLSTMHSADLLAEALKALIDRSGIDPAEVEQVVGGCVSQVGMQAFNIARTAWLTAGLPISAPATTRRQPMRLVAASHELRHQPRRLGRRRRRGGVRSRGHEPGADGLVARAWARCRQGGAEELLREVRVHLPIRGRRAHRREVGPDPWRCRRVRCAVTTARRGGLGRRPVRYADRADRRARSRRRRQADGLHAIASSATRVSARPPSNPSPDSSPSHARTVCTPQQPHRRSPTAPARCCS